MCRNSLFSLSKSKYGLHDRLVEVDLSCNTCNSSCLIGVVGLGGPLAFHHFSGFVIGSTYVGVVENGI